MTLPIPFAVRRRRTRRHAALLVLAAALGSLCSPMALVLLPLAIARAWRMRAYAVALSALAIAPCSAAQWIDLPALAAQPAALAGPWIALLVGTVATAAAWATVRRETHELLRVAALLTAIAAPWAPASGLLLATSLFALGQLRAKRPSRLPLAANDNAPALHARFPFRHAPRLSYPSLRRARPAAYD